jgi:HlyD family secretion protein
MTSPNIGPYQYQLVGTGIVEPSSSSIYIGTPVNRVVSKILVRVGEEVKEGQDLLVLENKDLLANLNVQRAAYKSEQAKLEKMKSLPRPEDLAIAKNDLNSAKATFDMAQSQNEMVLQLSDPRAVSQEEKNRRLFAYQEAQAKFDQAQSTYEKTKSGIWKPDLDIAELEVQQSRASLNLAATEVERTIIKSPINGMVLQIKIHEGELPSMDTLRSPLMIIGDIQELYLRVSINQLDIPLFNPKSPAVAYLQGNNKSQFPLEFVRVEPLLVNKQNLTNEINEKVDTRVLQIIYRIKNEGHPIFVGQQMDVFIETKEHHKHE